jgi:hypothetical protein
MHPVVEGFIDGTIYLLKFCYFTKAASLQRTIPASCFTAPVGFVNVALAIC